MMKTGLQLLIVVVGIMVAKLTVPYWPNQHVYGTWNSILVNPHAVELLHSKNILSLNTINTIICRFDEATVEDNLPYVVRLFDVADGKTVIMIVTMFEQLSVYSKLVHEDVQFVYEITTKDELPKWNQTKINQNCNVTIRMTLEMYRFTSEYEFPISLYLSPSGRIGDMLILSLMCPKQRFADIIDEEPELLIGVYKDISHLLVPEIMYNVIYDSKNLSDNIDSSKRDPQTDKVNQSKDELENASIETDQQSISHPTDNSYNQSLGSNEKIHENIPEQIPKPHLIPTEKSPDIQQQQLTQPIHSQFQSQGNRTAEYPSFVGHDQSPSEPIQSSKSEPELPLHEVSVDMNISHPSQQDHRTQPQQITPIIEAANETVQDGQSGSHHEINKSHEKISQLNPNNNSLLEVIEDIKQTHSKGVADEIKAKVEHIHILQYDTSPQTTENQDASDSPTHTEIENSSEHMLNQNLEDQPDHNLQQLTESTSPIQTTPVTQSPQTAQPAIIPKTGSSTHQPYDIEHVTNFTDPVNTHQATHNSEQMTIPQHTYTDYSTQISEQQTEIYQIADKDGETIIY